MTDKKKKLNTSTIFIRDIPNDIKNQFKALCAMQGKSMHEVLVDVLKKAIRENQK